MTKNNTITNGRGVAKLMVEESTLNSGFIATGFKKKDLLNFNEKSLWQFYHKPYSTETIIDISKEMIEEKKNRICSVMF